MRNFNTHIWYYTLLVLILTLGGFLISKTAFDRSLQILIAFTTTFFYVLFGVVHHRANHTLKAKVVVEYILVGSLGMSIIFLLIS